jgi:DHA1 family multidrug resistance protein-like MFS transporter
LLIALISMTRDNRLLAFSLACWGLGEGLFIYIEPLYLRQLGADPVAIGTILAIAAAAAGLAHIPAGYVADQLGRKPVLLAGWVLGLVSVLGMFLAQNLWLFAAGLVAYTFTGFVIAPIYAYTAVARGPQSMQRALTMVSAGFFAGMVVSPALGSLITRLTSLRMVFGASALVFMLSTVAIALLKPQPREAPPAGQSRYAALFRNRRFLGFLALIFSAATAMQVGLPLTPNFVVEARGFDAALVGLLGSANSAGVVVLNLALGQRLPRRGFMLAQVCLALSLILLLVTTSQGWLFVVYFLRAGWNLSHSMAAAQVGRVVEAAESGLAFGMIETVSSAATIVGPLVAGVLYARAPAAPFVASLALIGVTLPLVWRFAPRRDAHTPEPAGPVEASLAE